MKALTKHTMEESAKTDKGHLQNPTANIILMVNDRFVFWDRGQGKDLNSPLPFNSVLKFQAKWPGQNHIHIYIYKYTHIYIIHSYIYTHICMHMHIYVHMHILIHMYTQLYTCTYTYIHKHSDITIGKEGFGGMTQRLRMPAAFVKDWNLILSVCIGQLTTPGAPALGDLTPSFSLCGGCFHV